MIRLYRMDCLNAIKLLAVLMFVHGASGQTVNVSGPSEAANGTSVSLTCALNGGSAARIDWVEVFESGTSTIFNGEDIFSINPKYSNFKVTSYSQTGSVLTIENADVEDDGAYRCLIPSDEFATPKNLVVEAASTKTLTLTSIVTDNEDMYVATCYAAGGKPQETIKWFLNEDEQTGGTNGNTIDGSNPPATAPLSNTMSVFTFPATLENYGQTLVCQVSGHDVLTELNGNKSEILDIHTSPSATGITVTVDYKPVTQGTGIIVSCNAEMQPEPAMRIYYIFSNGTSIHESMDGANEVTVSDPIEGTEYTCIAGNYRGNTTLSDAVKYVPISPAGLSAGAYAGIAIGVIACIVIIVVIVLYLLKPECCPCFGGSGPKSTGSSKPARSAVGSSNGSEKEKTRPQAAPRGHGSIQHTNDNPNQDMYAMVDKKKPGGDAPDRGSGPGQNEPPGMLYADLDLSHQAGHTEKHVPKNENDVVVYSSILV